MTRYPVKNSVSMRHPMSWMGLYAVLCGCTSGGGDNVSIAQGQQGEDPVVLEIPVAYITRPVPEEPLDLREPLAFNPGARLYVRERSALEAQDIEITPALIERVASEEGLDPATLRVDIKGLESSFDGKQLVFSARAVAEPVDANLEFTTWNLWTLDMTTLQPNYLIDSRTKRDEGVEYGGGHDIDPHFLTDDRLVFSSTRQVGAQARLLNEGRGQIFAAMDEDGRSPAAVLHVYDPRQRDAEFAQISFNLSHDLDPVVLDSGEILFSRWSNTTTDHISLYRINPDGDSKAPLYGYHSQDFGTGGTELEYTQPRALDDGRILSLVRPFNSASHGGDIAIIDTDGWIDIDQPTPDNSGGSGDAQAQVGAGNIRTDGSLSPGGQYTSVYPLRDGSDRLLVSWSECLAQDAEGVISPCTLAPEDAEVAEPLYGGWVYDPASNTQRPVIRPQAGFMVSEFIAAEPRDFPDLVGPLQSFDADLAVAGLGRLRIDSVYDLNGVDASPAGIANHARPGSQAFMERPARFLRIVRPVPLPDPDVLEIPRTAAGLNRGLGFREIAGYIPVEPDGSVSVALEAGQAFSFSVLDASGRRIGDRHDYWLQLAPGEVLHCTGCHERGNTLPHGRSDYQPPSANSGAVALSDGSTGFPGTDTSTLFATEPGQTMAEIRDLHQPAASAGLALAPAYVDDWSGPGSAPQDPISGLEYDPEWTDIPAENPIVVNNLDPAKPPRIVINYLDHIQPVWERARQPVDDGSGNLVDRCTGCHDTAGDTMVPAGQLDLSANSSDIEPDHVRAYRELLGADAEQWTNDAGNLADRQRVCEELDADGNLLSFTETVTVAPSMRSGSANGSRRFFACFEGGSCGRDPAPALPANCSEDNGEPVPATRDTVDHRGLLSPAELRLLSEWLDIGAQYYNNPFDPRLQQ